LLSVVSTNVGAGKTFGLHELMDQIGAVLGPASLGIILLWTNESFSLAFNALFLPYIILLFLVIYTYTRIKDKVNPYISLSERRNFTQILRDLPTRFRIYVAAITLNTIGLIHWSLILYQANLIVSAWIVSFLYVVIQLVDAIAAPIMGYLYDKWGRILLFIPFLLSIIPTSTTLIGGWSNIIIASLFFGLVYGMQESIYRAAIVDIVSIDIRGTAYGVFNAFYGLGLFSSGVIFGWLITMNINPVVGIIFSIAMQLTSIPLLLKSLGHF
jgi:MFS family permease